MRDSSLPNYLRDAQKLQQLLKLKPERHWTKRGEQMAFKLFHEMAVRVPAYKDFLAKNQLNPNSIKSIKEFVKIPPVNKDNYLRLYPRQDLCWDGKFADGQWVISTTSGSTGEPFYFPRTNLQDDYYALTAELYLRENFSIQNKSTLYIDAFAMGAWIGGLFTYEAIKRVAGKGYAISIITPGINKDEVISSVRKLGPDFDQVIIGCYPPIMRDIIDLGQEQGLNWADYNLGIVFSAEGFSEEFRDYMVDHASLANTYTSSINHYGTVDLGTMSHETPLSILIRRQATEDGILFNSIFGDVKKQPTFTQFIPEMFYFEQVNNNVLCSSYSGLPLVRYELMDHGGVIGLADIEKIYHQKGNNLQRELKKAEIDKTRWNLPFVYIYERNDFAVTFLAARIFPEVIRKGLLSKTIEDKVTGKFTMEVVTDEKMISSLQINVELRQQVESSSIINQAVEKAVTSVLLAQNSEYASSYKATPKQAIPKIILWPADDPLYFSGNGKQKWVKK